MIRVLIVDDDPDILVIVRGALEVEGHHVVASSDPRRAVALATEHDVDVIVLDVNMPGMSGFDTLDALRDEPRTAGLPILFLSALGDSEHRIRGLRKGAEDYLAKPFEPDELVLRVERLAARLHRTGATSGSDPELLGEALRTGDFRSGQVYFGRYQALGVLGEGAMGVVLRGWDPRLKRQVALKTVRLDRLALGYGSKDALTQLVREATSLARFNHPNIVAVFDAGTVLEDAYIVMELVDGVSMLDRFDDGPLSITQASHLGIAVARALAAAHDRGMVHRDVKPGNILLGRNGSIKVTDFGVAEVVSSLADGHRIFGTPGFVPPECLHGEAHTPAGDVFGLGTVLYKGLAGKSAFAGSNLRELLANNLACQATPLHKVRSGIPRRLRKLVAELLREDPASRPTAAEVARRLAAMPAGEPEWDFEHIRARDPAIGSFDSGRLIDTRNLGHREDAPRTKPPA